jgi:hypothetical protein
MPPKTRYPEYIALRLETDMKAKLEKIADEEERTVGAVIRIILREGLATREAKGLRAAKRGNQS